jgi:phosphoesterase RecJ-like protein
MLTKIIDEKLIQKAKHLLLNSENIVIISHTGPDGDAVGSTLALSDFLKQIGKNVQVMYPDNFPVFLNWMPGAKDTLTYKEDKEKCETFLKESDLIVMIDFNQLKRIGPLGEIAGDSKSKKLLLDHHPYPDDFADVAISYPQISSSSEIVFRLICRGGFFDYITKECAECIYTGMMTDTGSFTFNSNNVEMYFIISQLLSKGIDKDVIYDKVFNTYSKDRMKLMGFVLHERLEILDDETTAVITLSKNDLQKFKYKVGDTEGFVNMPLSIEGIKMSIFFREEEDGIKVSVRSKGEIPANKLASELFGGGGHLNAAGGEFKGTLEEAVKKIKQNISNYIN